MSRFLLCTLGFFAAAGLAGCADDDPVSTPGTTAASTASATTETSHPTGVSPGGVTTSVEAAAGATESEYGQSCHAAKLWMDGRGGDPATLVEPYLAVLQDASTPPGPGSFGVPWAELTAAQQAGVIMAVNGAATGACE